MAKKPQSKPKPEAVLSFKDAAKKALEKKIAAIEAKELTHSSVSAFHDLLELCRKDLSPGHEHHLRKRTKEEITGLLNLGGDMVGFAFDGKLIGGALLIIPDPDTTNYDINPDTGLIVGAFLIHPSYRGMGISKALMATIQRRAMEMGRPNLVGRVASGHKPNKASQGSFESAAFKQAKTATWYPLDGHVDGGYYAHDWYKTVKSMGAAAKHISAIGHGSKSRRLVVSS